MKAALAALCCLLVSLPLFSCSRPAVVNSIAAPSPSSRVLFRDRASSPLAFVPSGTVILSKRAPSRDENPKTPGRRDMMAPLIGYLPPAASYSPADNELWISVDSTAARIELLMGKRSLKILNAEGKVAVKRGAYYLSGKEVDPLWYASDSYCSRRGIAPDSKGRYLKGALGSRAIFVAPGLLIHSSPLWTEEVGGLKLSGADMLELYDALSLGSPVLVN